MKFFKSLFKGVGNLLTGGYIAAKEQMKANEAAAKRAEAIANAPQVQAAPTVTMTNTDNEIAEQNEATAKKKAFGFAKTSRAAGKTTLG